MPTAVVQPALNSTSSLATESTPVASQPDYAIAPSLQEFKDYYQVNHDFEWDKRPNRGDRTLWSGTLNDDNGEHKLVLSTFVGESEVQDMFYVYSVPSTTQVNSEQKKIIYDALTEIAIVSLPTWESGENWIVSSLDSHFDTGKDVFQLDVNGKTVEIAIGPSTALNDFGAMFSIY